MPQAVSDAGIRQATPAGANPTARAQRAEMPQQSKTKAPSNQTQIVQKPPTASTGNKINIVA